MHVTGISGHFALLHHQMINQFFFDGISHITDTSGYDHMLFLVALCAPFAFRQWKTLVWLATAFTVGHSLSLILAGLDIIRFPSILIEILIPVTIIITCVLNFTERNKSFEGIKPIRYLATIGFGVIHGMGFSSYFRMLFDDSSEVVQRLLFFNLGVEAGQILIILVYLLIAALIVRSGFKQKKVSDIVSICALLISTYLLFEKIVS